MEGLSRIIQGKVCTYKPVPQEAANTYVLLGLTTGTSLFNPNSISYCVAAYNLTTQHETKLSLEGIYVPLNIRDLTPDEAQVLASYELNRLEQTTQTPVQTPFSQSQPLCNISPENSDLNKLRIGQITPEQYEATQTPVQTLQRPCEMTRPEKPSQSSPLCTPPQPKVFIDRSEDREFGPSFSED